MINYKDKEMKTLKKIYIMQGLINGFELLLVTFSILFSFIFYTRFY